MLPGAPQRTVPTPIEFYNGGGGPATLLSYRNGGRAISRFIKDFEPDDLPAPVSQLTWRLTLESFWQHFSVLGGSLGSLGSGLCSALSLSLTLALALSSSS